MALNRQAAPLTWPRYISKVLYRVERGEADKVEKDHCPACAIGESNDKDTVTKNSKLVKDRGIGPG